MDLLKFDSVRKAAAEFRSRTDKLNVLVNNAGKFEKDLTTVNLITTDAYRQVLLRLRTS